MGLRHRLYVFKISIKRLKGQMVLKGVKGLKLRPILLILLPKEKQTNFIRSKNFRIKTNHDSLLSKYSVTYSHLHLQLFHWTFSKICIKNFIVQTFTIPYVPKILSELYRNIYDPDIYLSRFIIITILNSICFV